MTNETIALKARHISNSQVIGNIDELIRTICPNRDPDNVHYLQITEWLYFKLQKEQENVFKIHGLYVWARALRHEELCQDNHFKTIAKTILEDMTVLGEK